MNNDISIMLTAKLFVKKFLLIMFSVWSYIPIIVGILFPMIIILPIAYASWIISSLLSGELLFEGYIPISPEYSFQYIFLLVIEVIIFIGGIFVFLLGLYHLTKGKKQKLLIVTTGIYHYIRHPQNLGICLIVLPFALYIPGFNDLGIRVGEIFSWLLFTFILTIYSNLEEKFLLTKFSKEYSPYQHYTGFFFPKLSYRMKIFSKKGLIMTTQKRYAFLFLSYIISVIVVFFIIELLLALNLITWILYF